MDSCDFPGLTFARGFARKGVPHPPMIREIVQYGHPVLRQKCRSVTEVNDDLIRLVADMLETMVDADGIGHASAGFASTIHGGNRGVAFNAETGEVVESKVNFEPFTESGYPGPKNNTTIFTEPQAGGWRLAGRAMTSWFVIACPPVAAKT